MCQRRASTPHGQSPPLPTARISRCFRQRVLVHGCSAHQNHDQQQKHPGPLLCVAQGANRTSLSARYWTDVSSFTNTPFPKRPLTESTNYAAVVDIHGTATLQADWVHSLALVMRIAYLNLPSECPYTAVQCTYTLGFHTAVPTSPRSCHEADSYVQPIMLQK
jgi:hypothetical protein